MWAREEHCGERALSPLAHAKLPVEGRGSMRARQDHLGERALNPLPHAELPVEGMESMRAREERHAFQRCWFVGFFKS